MDEKKLVSVHDAEVAALAAWKEWNTSPLRFRWWFEMTHDERAEKATLEKTWMNAAEVWADARSMEVDGSEEI